jgi:hypothetical protein
MGELLLPPPLISGEAGDAVELNRIVLLVRMDSEHVVGERRHQDSTGGLDRAVGSHQLDHGRHPPGSTEPTGSRDPTCLPAPL